MEARPIVKAALILSVAGFASLLLSLAFLGRYLDEKTVLDALGPALASPDPVVASSALELIRESVPPSRYSRLEKAISKRLWARVGAKYLHPELSLDSLRRLHQEIEITALTNPHWSQEYEHIDAYVRTLALNRLASWIERDGQGEAGATAMRAGLAALRDNRCGDARAVFRKPFPRSAESTARFGLHLSEVCFLGPAKPLVATGSSAGRG